MRKQFLTLVCHSSSSLYFRADIDFELNVALSRDGLVFEAFVDVFESEKWVLLVDLHFHLVEL
jgi:hypothetical protein